MKYQNIKVVDPSPSPSDTISVTRDRLFDQDPGLLTKFLSQARIQTRNSSSELDKRSFFLSPAFDWVVVKDNDGNLCLVPLKKK